MATTGGETPHTPTPSAVVAAAGSDAKTCSLVAVSVEAALEGAVMVAATMMDPAETESEILSGVVSRWAARLALKASASKVESSSARVKVASIVRTTI